jgi:hypothetical protein
MLREVMVEVVKVTTPEERAATWAYRYTSGLSKGTVEFHAPLGYYFHGQGCCKWYAKAEGWSEWVRRFCITDEDGNAVRRKTEAELKAEGIEFEKEVKS